jgi:Protein of unknown function (DUF1439)
LQIGKWLICALLVLAAMLVGGYFYLHGKTWEVRLTQAELRDRIDSHFPLTKSYLIFALTLQQPRVVLHDGSDRVGLGVDVVLNIRINDQVQALGGSIDIESAIRYEADKGQFFLTDPDIQRLDVQGIPDRYIAKVRELAKLELGQQFARFPVYTLPLANLKTAAARVILRRVEINSGVLVLTLGI